MTGVRAAQLTMSKKLDLVAVDHGTIHAKAAMQLSLLNDPMYNVHIGTQQLIRLFDMCV
jgi:hypothetical protein